MERVAADVEALHLCIGDFDAFDVGPGIERAFDFEASLRRGRSDQLAHGGATGKGAAALCIGADAHRRTTGCDVLSAFRSCAFAAAWSAMVA